MMAYDPGANQRTAFQFFVSKGLSAAQAAGIVGNLMQESGVNPESIQMGGPGRGIAQWSQGQRWNPELMTGNPEQDLVNQLNYMWQELNGSESQSLQAIRGAQTATQAADIFEQYYERAGTPSNGARESYATNVLGQAQSQNWSQGITQAMFGNGGGGIGAGGTGNTSGANYGASQGSVDQYIEQNYPTLAWMYTIPELNPIFQQADSNQWSEGQLQAALQNTNWWKSHSESARSWEQLNATDPASAERELQQAEVQIETLFRQFGVQADPTLIQNLAAQKMELGLNDQELQLAVLTNASFKYTESQYGQNGGGGGDIGSYMAEIKQKASQYFYKISDQSAYQWATKMLQTGANPTSADNDAGFTPFLQQQAVSQYPWLKQQIVGEGMTLQQFFDPYKQQTASLMEQSPYSIDIQNNPTWAKMGSFVDQNGVKRSMTLSEAATYARSQPGWNFTQNANQQYSDMGTQLLKSLGAIGG